ncbi:uncharacterized protein JCM10292_002224 [Rhodotorula paludigena]|uniref:uncharacterized protein n=1 Tax=Rhodotorula paludigena TaxID=86838 RepID=UPI00316FED53
MLASTALLCLLSLQLVSALPLPQGSFPAVQTPDSDSSATTSTASAPVNPATPAPDVQESTSSSSSTTNPADLSGLLSSLGDLQSLSGTSEGATTDRDALPSSEFSSFGQGAPQDSGLFDSLSGFAEGAQGQGGLSGLDTSSPPASSAAVAPLLVAEKPSSTTGLPTFSSMTALDNPSESAASPLELIASTTWSQGAPTAMVDPAAQSAAPETFDLDNFMAGASFPEASVPTATAAPAA